MINLLPKVQINRKLLYSIIFAGPYFLSHCFLLLLLQVGFTNGDKASKVFNKDGVIGLCVQAMIDGVDEDVNAWSEEKPT